MEELIMSQFEKQNSKVGDILMMRNLNNGILRTLNPKQQDEAINAINSLIDRQFVTYEKGNLECLRLTELGFKSLYKNSKTTSDIEKLILDAFEKQNSRANHILMIKNLNHTIFQNLNPIEKQLIEDAVNNLENKGFVKYEDASSGPECLRLTELGYENLY